MHVSLSLLGNPWHANETQGKPFILLLSSSIEFLTLLLRKIFPTYPNLLSARDIFGKSPHGLIFYNP